MSETEDNLVSEPLKQDVPKKDIIEIINDKITEVRKELKKNTKNKKSYFIISIIGIILLMLYYTKVYSVNAFLLVVFWVCAILFLIASLGTDIVNLSDDLENLQQKKTYYLQVLKLDQAPTYFDSLVNINVDNLSDYYTLVKVHTNKSFMLCCMSCISGFILIILGLVVIFLNKNLENISYIVTASGIIVEVISGLFFYLYNKTVRQLKDYHDSLLNVQNILLSFKLIESTSNDIEKFAMIKSMIDFLVGKKTI
ncbi:hypothetical protein [Clostridium sp.]|uniref:TRADD-N-associated membrane domain-containing protein n=1 Tax=Clostridium sp. TaxID=1506 RepID=UPI001A51E3A0|nr:hypothetical protein [Clostridium sp.]MBK5234895.1 hypothetical protein [Clostridium sp.]